MKFRNYSLNPTGEIVKAVPMKIEFILSTKDMAIQLTSMYNRGAISAAMQKTEVKLISDIKATLYNNGMKCAEQFIADSELEQVCNYVEKILTKRFVK